jgi:hypothetical protein
MPSGTTETLTAIAGVENGGDFGLAAAEGELFAVGWKGTVLHYNPNPDGDPLTDDGVWQIVAVPGAATPHFVSKRKVDPACPDYDGDGIPDDGDGDGFSGNALCTGGSSSACDDNCREVANGTLRPFVDVSPAIPDGCIGPGDEPAAQRDPGTVQLDADSDGVGLVCDDDDTVAKPAAGFASDLYAVAAAVNGASVDVVAVGEGGAVVSYHGPSAAGTVAPAPGIDSANAWLAQVAMAFRYSDDCPAGTAAGTSCGNGRLPPDCPAMCNPQRTACPCPSGQGQCCSASASTGASCSDGSCGMAANACQSNGDCNPLCPSCFRRLDQGLYGVAIDGDTVVAVGLGGTFVQGSVADPGGVWSAPACTPMPAPLDARPRLNAVGASGGAFLSVGQNGSLIRYPGGDCSFAPVAGGPTAYLSAVKATSASSAYVAGDGGQLFSLQGDTPTTLDPRVTENLLSISTTYADGYERLWIVGGGGVVVTGAYY